MGDVIRYDFVAMRRLQDGEERRAFEVPEMAQAVGQSSRPLFVDERLPQSAILPQTKQELINQAACVIVALEAFHEFPARDKAIEKAYDKLDELFLDMSVEEESVAWDLGREMLLAAV